MKTPALFVLGLAIGAIVVFAIRAISLGEAASPDEPAGAHDGVHPGDGEAAGPPPAPASGVGDAHGPHDDHAARDDRPPENLICPVMGNEVDPDVYVDYEGRRIWFCCEGCDEAFLADPEKYLQKVDAELAARKAGK